MLFITFMACRVFVGLSPWRTVSRIVDLPSDTIGSGRWQGWVIHELIPRPPIAAATAGGHWAGAWPKQIGPEHVGKLR